MINLDEERGLVYSLLKKYKLPISERDDKFQDFAVFFYERYNYNEDYKKSSYIQMLFMNWLSHCAKLHKTKNRVMDSLSIRLEDKREDWREWVQAESEGYIPIPAPDMTTYCEELVSMFKPLTREYILDKSVCERVAKEEGVSRQAIQHRINRDMDKVLKNL